MAAPADFTIPPYIQNPGTTQMPVVWESDSLDEATVTVRQDQQTPRTVSAPKPVTASYHEDPANPESPRYTRHVYEVKLTGL